MKKFNQIKYLTDTRDVESEKNHREYKDLHEVVKVLGEMLMKPKLLLTRAEVSGSGGTLRLR
ncbi:MAG: hypothetical protein OEM00_06690 [Burkholderiaceae bacterium]|nr:hypothetical protein [Burkholderiaceae bacterium]